MAAIRRRVDRLELHRGVIELGTVLVVCDHLHVRGAARAELDDQREIGSPDPVALLATVDVVGDLVGALGHLELEWHRGDQVAELPDVVALELLARHRGQDLQLPAATVIAPPAIRATATAAATPTTVGVVARHVHGSATADQEAEDRDALHAVSLRKGQLATQPRTSKDVNKNSNLVAN